MLAISATEYNDLQIDEICREISRYGIKNLEAWIDFHIYDDKKDLARAAFEKYEVNLICVSSWTPLLEPGKLDQYQNDILRSINLASEFGAPFINTYFGCNNDLSVEEALEKYTQGIAPCVRAAEEKGITILLENEFSQLLDNDRLEHTEPTSSAVNCKKLVEMVDSPYFKLNFDAANFFIGGEEAYPYAYEILKEHIDYVHLKNATKLTDAWKHKRPNAQIWNDYFRGDFLCVPLEEGAVNYWHFLKRLAVDKYDGPLVLEPHIERENIHEAMLSTLEFFKTNFYGD